jgi:uncharacterized protein (DUF1501 family)
MMSNLHTTTRRALLKKMAALPLASAATPMALQLLGMANAAAQSANDYKALVCVFLFGANDHYNTVVPYDTANYNAYYNVRKGAAIPGTPYEGIALTRSSLDSTVLGTAGLPSGMQMALGPTMTGMKSLYDAGKLGVLLNVGPLLVPTSIAQYNNKSVPLPPKLFSHNDQQAYWHTGGQAEGGTSGWGGRTADLILSDNSKAALSCVSVNGNAVYLSGNRALSYQISSSGASTITAVRSNSLYGSAACAAALKTLVTQNSAHWLEHEHAQVMNRALDTYEDVFGAIGTAPSTELNSKFPSANLNPNPNSLSQQLRMVARLMEKRQDFGIKRQVFFVGLGGFDLHDFLANQHPGLLDRVSKAMVEFNDALEYLGLSQQVTTFTGSDFGRTLASNGDGSDHGWGSHHFIMGGAVNGGRFYGSAPPIGVTHTQQVGSGRLLPSTATEQMSAELARWFGVSNADMPDVLPNARYFDLHRLGMLRNV